MKVIWCLLAGLSVTGVLVQLYMNMYKRTSEYSLNIFSDLEDEKHIGYQGNYWIYGLF